MATLPPGEFVYDGVSYSNNCIQSVFERVKDFKTNNEDICIASYPKCGTTWTSQILCQVYPEVCNPEVPLPVNVPVIECNGLMNMIPEERWPIDGLAILKDRKSPRLIKTHLQAKYLQKQVEDNNLKVIVPIRNIKDTLVSYYHYYQSCHGYQGSFEDFYQLFKEDKLRYGNYFEHIKGWLALCHLPNVLLIRYEDLKADLVGGIKKIANFCGRRYPDEVIANMAEKCEFKAMKSNPLTNYVCNMIRAGEVGGWRKYFTKEMETDIDGMIQLTPHYIEVFKDIIE